MVDSGVRAVASKRAKLEKYFDLYDIRCGHGGYSAICRKCGFRVYAGNIVDFERLLQNHIHEHEQEKAPRKP